MTNRERVKAVLNGQKPADRLPVVEWASWWDKTVFNWQEKNPEIILDSQKLFTYFGLDSLTQFWVSPRGAEVPQPKSHGAPLLETEEEFKAMLPHLFPEEDLKVLRQNLMKAKPIHDAGDTAVWFTLEGFFWFPRTLFGIENHLYAFYDYPELMHEMNRRLADFHLKTIEVIYDVLTPEFMTFAEDMSYNHGPMLSKECYDEFMKPYYEKVIPSIKAQGTKVLIDTDGDVQPLIPWFQEVGIEGVLPLERQAGVDVNFIRENYPEWIMIGGYDKTVMHLGEEAMRKEFERIFPAMCSGRYIPSVDHQTPPDVTEENYRIYVKLLKEYAQKAVK